jgi:hypothetical protein
MKESWESCADGTAPGTEDLSPHSSQQCGRKKQAVARFEAEFSMPALTRRRSVWKLNANFCVIKLAAVATNSCQGIPISQPGVAQRREQDALLFRAPRGGRYRDFMSACGRFPRRMHTEFS